MRIERSGTWYPNLSKIFFFVCFSISSIILYAQGDPIYEEGFEGVHGWTLVNGTPDNKWHIGTVAQPWEGVNSLYISQNGTAHTYRLNQTAVVQAYRDIAIPAGVTTGSLQFYFRSYGQSGQDYFRVWMVPTTFIPTAGTQIGAAAGRIQVGEFQQNSTGWFVFTGNVNLTSFAGGNMRLVFEWRNNNSSGNQPPASIDNIRLGKSCVPSTYISSGAGGDYIKTFSTTNAMVNINNANSGYTNPPEGYGDFYSTHSVSQSASGTISFSAEPGSTLYTRGLRIWVDWNGNGTFEAGEIMYTSPSVTNGTHTGSFNVPAGQALGNYRMRVMLRYGTTMPSMPPCDTGFFGEVEDYKLTVLPPAPEINVYGQAGAQSSIEDGNISPTYFLGTDFGRVLTSGAVEIRPFTIQNTGTLNLDVTSVSITGVNASDFTLTTDPSGIITPGNSVTFNIEFSPNSEGYKEAFVEILNNDSNENPYTFKIQGYGVECTMNEDIIAIQNFDNNGTSNLPTAVVAGTAAYANINSGSTFFPNNENMYLGVRSWQIRNRDVMMDYGPVDVSNMGGVQFKFDVAAFGTTAFTGPNNNDLIAVYVSNDGGVTWSTELIIVGHNTFSQHQFGSSPIADTVYNGLGDYVGYENGNGFNYGVGTIAVSIPEDKVTNNMMFSIRSISSRTQSIWLIDNVRVVRRDNPVTKTYTTSGWRDQNNNPTSTPLISEKAIIDEDFSGENLTACECQVESGKNLTITANNYADIYGNIINDGTIVVESDGNFSKRSNTATYTGGAGSIFRSERLITSISNIPSQMDYVYWSSPVTGQDLKLFSPGTPNNRFFEYNEATDYFVPTTLPSNFITGKGYAIRAEAGLTNGQNKTYSFTGIPNNGNLNHNIEIVKVGQGYNLVGNPYPSNIDADLLFEANPSIYTSVFFWSNTNYDFPNQQGSRYNGSNYSVYNKTGGNPATYPATIGSVSTTDNVIKAGQGFIVQKIANGNSTLVFDNNMRISDAGTFYEKTDKDRFWLTLTTPSELVNTTLIGFIPGAVDEYDPNYDAEHLGGSDAIFTTLGTRQLVIQGLEYPLEKRDVISLGVRHFEAGKHIISLKTKEGIFDGNQKVYLKDKYLNKIHNLSKSNYKYIAEPGEFNDRFEIVFINSNMTAESVLATASDVKIQKINNQIAISSQKDQLLEVEIYNFAGWSLYQNNSVNAKELILPAEQFGKGIIVIKVQTETGEIVSQKMIIK